MTKKTDRRRMNCIVCEKCNTTRKADEPCSGCKDREIVEAATPGPWEKYNITDVFTCNGGKSKYGCQADSRDGWQIADCSIGQTFVSGGLYALNMEEQKRNAQYISHFNPQKLSEMLDRIEQLESENAQLKADLEAELNPICTCDRCMGYEDQPQTICDGCAGYGVVPCMGNDALSVIECPVCTGKGKVQND